jgi:hypothetical protein
MTLQIETRILLRPAAREGGDALDEVEHGFGRTSFLGQYRVHDLGGLGLPEPALAQEIGAVLVRPRDDALARLPNAVDEWQRRGVRKPGQRGCNFMREAVRRIFAVPDADLFKILNTPEVAVLADGAEIEAGDAERFGAHFAVPAIETPEVEVGRSIGQLARLDGIEIVDQEQEHVAVAGVKRGRIGADIDHGIVDTRRPVEHARHLPARISRKRTASTPCAP